MPTVLGVVNGGALQTNASGTEIASFSSILLGFQNFSAAGLFPTPIYCEFIGLYAIGQIADLVTASTASPPAPTGPANWSADFINGVYYLNGAPCLLSDLFVVNTDGSVAPPNFTIDVNGAYLYAGNTTGEPVAGGSGAVGTPAAVAAASALAFAGGFAVIVKYVDQATGEGSTSDGDIIIMGGVTCAPASIGWSIKDACLGVSNRAVMGTSVAGVGADAPNAPGVLAQIATSFAQNSNPCGLLPPPPPSGGRRITNVSAQIARLDAA